MEDSSHANKGRIDNEVIAIGTLSFRCLRTPHLRHRKDVWLHPEIKRKIHTRSMDLGIIHTQKILTFRL